MGCHGYYTLWCQRVNEFTFSSTICKNEQSGLDGQVHQLPSLVETTVCSGVHRELWIFEACSGR